MELIPLMEIPGIKLVRLQFFLVYRGKVLHFCVNYYKYIALIAIVYLHLIFYKWKIVFCTVFLM